MPASPEQKNLPQRKDMPQKNNKIDILQNEILQTSKTSENITPNLPFSKDGNQEDKEKGIFQKTESKENENLPSLEKSTPISPALNKPLNFTSSVPSILKAIITGEKTSNDKIEAQTKTSDLKISGDQDEKNDDPDDCLTKFIKRVFNDPQITRIMEIIISCIGFFMVSWEFRPAFFGAPYRLIQVPSAIYSLFALYVTVVCKCEKKVPQCTFIQKIFVGRKIYWHEIDLAFSSIFLFANITIFSLMFFCQNGIIFPLTFFSIFLYANDWYKSAMKGKKFKNKKVSPKDCITNVVKFFKTSSLVFNIIRLVVLLCIHFHYDAMRRRYSNYFIFCNAMAVFGSFILTFLIAQPDLAKYLSTKLIPIGKMKTYLSLLIFTGSLMAVATEWSTGYYRYMGWFKDSEEYNENILSPSDPRYLVILSIMFKLTILDLYSQAIFNQSVPRGEGEEENDETMEPTQIKIDDEKTLKNLPKTIENPFFIDSKAKINA